MSRVSIVLDLPASEYRALAAIAGHRGIQAHVLVEQLVRHALTTTSTVPTARAPMAVAKPESKYVARPMPKLSKAIVRSDRDEQFVAVAKFHGEGMDDGQIAAAVGITRVMARRRRVLLKLPSLGKPGRPRRMTNNDQGREAI